MVSKRQHIFIQPYGFEIFKIEHNCLRRAFDNREIYALYEFPSPKLPSLPTPLPLCPLPPSCTSCKLSLTLWTRLMRWRLMILKKFQSLIETNKKLQCSSWPT
ncbi:hypothetical protein MUK42_37519, partial [Musa troglodytarum]